MDSPATTPTLTSREIRVLHLEPTDVCQARCPQCARETDQHFDAQQQHHLSVADLQAVLPMTVLQNLRKVYMCGVYGDPAAGRHVPDIFQWFRDLTPSITLGMHSNGGLQNIHWWRRLAKILNSPNDYVVFSIDGLEDTNHVYRRGVAWTRLMQNAKAFIDAGGNAHWDMLVYQHNEHQVDQCQKLAQDLGFRWFRVKVSSRPLVGDLRSPIHWHNPKIVSQDIQCRAMIENSIYIDAQRRVVPCCWLAGEARRHHLDLDQIQRSWGTVDPHVTCAKTCGVSNNLSNFTSQWQREVELHV